MKCISKILIVFAVIGIGVFAFFKAKEEYGFLEYETILTEYEITNYNRDLYTGDFYAKDLCVATEDVSIEGFKANEKLYSSALFDITNGNVEFAANIHERIYPASTTKILTALVAMESCDLSDVVTISKEAAASSFAFDEQVCGLNEGDQLTLEALINGLLIWSGNDAAVAIAEHVGGSIENFADMMNQKAADLMATNTHFVTPNGLHDKEHYTTAYDLYLIFNECIKHEEFTKIVSSSSYTAEITDKDGKVREKKWDSTSFYARKIVPDPDGGNVIGGKTGYTSEAGNCLILLNEDENGRQYISIVMGAKDKPLLYEDMTAIINQIPNT